MRTSQAGLACVRRDGPTGPEYLAQWSTKWGMYSLVGGHVEVGETFRECVVREVAEELELPPSAFAVAESPVAPIIEYTALSGGAKVETHYRMGLYAVDLLTPATVTKVSAMPNNRWLSVPEILAERTADGQPISAQVKTVFTLSGVLEVFPQKGPRMTPFRHPKLFVSATSRGLKPLRQAVAGYLQGGQYEVVVQEEFAGDYQRIKDMIRDQLAPCDAVVLLVGPAYGFEPTDWPEGLPRRSYTQLEYDIAVELGKPVYRFLASDKYPLIPFDPEPADHAARQREYVAGLKAQDHIWYEFESEQSLLKLLENTRFHVRIAPNLPFGSIGTLFKGREDALTAVRRSLLTRPAHATAVTSKQAIHGLGGVGKTRFAVEYAHRYRAEYSAVLYSSADSPASLAANLAALAHVLHLPEAEEKEQAKQLEAVERWLRMHAGWLLILDNVDTVEAQDAVNAAFPKLASGHVLVTSRLTSGWATGVSAVELDSLSIPASTEFLLERTDRDPATPTKPARRVSDSDPADAKTLAEYLGGLALALEQAGAYICQHAITFAEYRARVSEVESTVLEWFDADVMKYPKSVAVTWQASVNELYDDGRSLLNLLCWLAPDPIPVALIKTEPKEPPHAPIKSREKALRQLQDYSLAKGNATGDAVTVHRLVQDVTRARLAGLEVLEDAVTAVHTYSQPDGRQFEESGFRNLWAAVLPHAMRVVAGPPHRAARQRAMITNNIGVFLAHHGRHEEALGWLNQVPSIAEAGDEPVEWTAINNSAEALRQRGELAEAERLYERLLERLRAERDVPPVWVAKTVSNLGLVYQETSRVRQAGERFREAARLLRQVPDCPRAELAKVLGNLGVNQFQSGQTAAAAATCAEALAIEEELLGPNSPAVARSLTNLSVIASAQGNRAEAEERQSRALQIYENWYGSDHPDTARAQLNLAELLREAGRAAEAEPLYHHARRTVEAVFGPWYHLLANILNGLALVCQSSDRNGDAQTHYTRALEILYRFFLATGHKHPNWDDAQQNLLAFLLKGRQMSETEAFDTIAGVLKNVAAVFPPDERPAGSAAGPPTPSKRPRRNSDWKK